MPTEESTLALADVQRLLEDAACGNPAAYGGLSLWTFTRDQLLNVRLGGLQLVSRAEPKKSCCSAGAPHESPSGLILGLRGGAAIRRVAIPASPMGMPAFARRQNPAHRGLDHRRST
jgi:hypothetical protein